MLAHTCPIHYQPYRISMNISPTMYEWSAAHVAQGDWLLSDVAKGDWWQV